MVTSTWVSVCGPELGAPFSRPLAILALFNHKAQCSLLELSFTYPSLVKVLCELLREGRVFVLGPQIFSPI